MYQNIEKAVLSLRRSYVPSSIPMQHPVHSQIKDPIQRKHQYRSHHLVFLASTENITKLLQRTSDKLGLLPQVGGQVSVCVTDSDEGGLEGVLEGLGGAGRGGVNVVDTGKLEKTLDSGGGNETGTTGSGDKLQKSVKRKIVPEVRGYLHEQRLNRTCQTPWLAESEEDPSWYPSNLFGLAERSTLQ